MGLMGNLVQAMQVRCPRHLRSELMEVVRVFNAKTTDLSNDTITIEIVGNLQKNAAIQNLLEPYGILELARTGRLALTRSSGELSLHFGVLEILLAFPLFLC